MTPARALPDQVHAAASWLATLPADQRPQQLVPALCSRFDLDVIQAVAAIRESRLIQARAN